MLTAKPRKALATIGVGAMAPVLDIALETVRPYAERHGYDVVGIAFPGPGASSTERLPLIA